MLLNIHTDVDTTHLVQPLAQGYLALPRAVATSLFYRYANVHTGYGACSRVTDASEALRDHTTPQHLVQICLAEWLLAYAGLAHLQAPNQVGAMGYLTGAGFDSAVTLVNSSKDLLADSEVLEGVAAGTHVPSLTAVLIFLADWYGAVAPMKSSLTRGDVRSIVKLALPLVRKLRIARGPMRAYMDVGSRLSPDAFVRALNVVLAGDGRDVHGSYVILGTAPDSSESAWRSMEIAGPTVHAIAGDVAGSLDATSTKYPPGFAMKVPRQMMVSATDAAEHLYTTREVCVVTARGKFFPVLRTMLADPVLMFTAMRASATTLASALGALSTGGAEPSSRDRLEIQSILHMLYVMAPKTWVAKTMAAVLDGAGQLDSDGEADKTDEDGPAESTPPKTPRTPPSSPKAHHTPQAEMQFSTKAEAVEEELQTSDEVETTGLAAAGEDPAVSPSRSSSPPVSTTTRTTSSSFQPLQPASQEQAVPEGEEKLQAFPAAVPPSAATSVAPSVAPSAAAPSAATSVTKNPFVGRSIFPGRHVDKTGPAMLTVYYTPMDWTSLAEERSKVLGFFHEFETVRTATGRTFFATVLENSFLPIVSLDRIPGDTAYVTGDVDCALVPSLAVDEPGLSRLTYSPFWSILLMREDLLWLIVQGSARARAALGTLWSKYHVRDLQGRRFKDAITDKLISQVCSSDTKFVEKGGKWVAGVMAEMVFSFSDESAIQPLLWTIEQGMERSCVVQYSSADSDDESFDFDDSEDVDMLGYGKRLPNGDIELAGGLMGNGKGDLVAVPYAGSGVVVSESQVSAWTETFNRGLNFTTTQAAVLTGVANASTCQAFAKLVDRCSPESINMTEMVGATRVDKQELQWYIKARRREVSDTDSRATLTL